MIGRCVCILSRSCIPTPFSPNTGTKSSLLHAHTRHRWSALISFGPSDPCLTSFSVSEFPRSIKYSFPYTRMRVVLLHETAVSPCSQKLPAFKTSFIKHCTLLRQGTTHEGTSKNLWNWVNNTIITYLWYCLMLCLSKCSKPLPSAVKNNQICWGKNSANQWKIQIHINSRNHLRQGPH